ncbi:MAG TPA: hypothetical protein VIH57_14685 [Bacteroidales bacterium]
MKNSIIILVLCIIFNPMQAQKIIERHMDFAQKNSLSLEIQIADSISIHTWDKKEVFTRASVDVNDNNDNDAYQTKFDESGSILKVTAKFEENYMKTKHNFNSKITWDVYIPENTSFSVKTIDGNINIEGKIADINAKSISGNIIIKGTNSEVEANSISGFVDLSVASDRKANLEFATISGTVYSNHDVNSSGKSKIGSTKISDQMNGGGNQIILKTISGNIYFRKI